ncbi:MAG: xanthine dehydrogenase family protein subunit M [Bryobacterales bacterium]|nr:xanthine dehydrogenase family protein subunit M [Bryobacterales bacterium]
MEAFSYANPASLGEALASLGTAWEDAAILAGGTDLITLMKQYVYSPAKVVNIKGLRELKGIERLSGGGFRIGAAVTLDELLKNRALVDEYPVVAMAARGVASPQMRHMGTVGGDLCQRPRCWYYRNGFGLLAQKDGKSLVTEGENQFHAILGHNGKAYFVSASSFGPAMVACGARLKVVSASGTREVNAEDFFRVPASDSEREVDLKPNEILTEILLPAAKGATGATYEVRQREVFDWPLATASVFLRMSGGKVSEARVVLGHVAPKPWRASAAESLLRGQTITEETATKAGEAAVNGAQPLSQNAYKVQLARVAVKRALLAARV